jgi:CRISPR/Cas system-associated exonuclease Cas4 (RecB family)
MIENTGWDLVRLLAPYLRCSTPSVDETLEIRTITVKLLDIIAKCSNPREVYLTILQTIKSLQFEGLSEGSDTAIGDIVLFIAMNNMLLISKRNTS